MKTTISLSVLFIAILVTGCGPGTLPKPFKDAVQVWSFSQNKGLKSNGPVITGAKMNDTDIAASRLRSGDEYAAQFNGGWLDAGQGRNNSLNFGEYGFTLNVRLRVQDGIWDKPIISKHGGSDKLAWSLYGLRFGFGDENWEMGRQNYLSYGDSTGRGYALEFELGVQPEQVFLDNKRKKSPDDLKRPDIANGIFRVGVPVAMIGAEQWHDVTVRFTGPKLEMFVDGVLVDEEWPIGKLRISSAPCLIGAIQMGEQLISGFKGEIADAAIWNRAISDDELIHLSGGKENVTLAELRILGPEKKSLQYWRPRYHNAWVGDVMPGYDEKNGRFHFFYLFDRRHHSSKWSVGAHQFAHISSSDLVNWEQHPLAVPITRQWESFGTGCPVVADNRIEMHYGLHTTRMFPVEATTNFELGRTLSEKGTYQPLKMQLPDSQWPQKDVPIGHSVSVSKDGIHFQKTDTMITPSQNMWIFREPEKSQFLMFWGRRSLTSPDLRQWKPSIELFPTGSQTATRNSDECPNYFEWNGWNYSIMGRTGFWMSRKLMGPYWEGPKGENRNSVKIPRWDIYDGLMVPMVASFKDNRRLLVGNTFSPKPHRGYAGYVVIRELIQYEDGTLGMKWPEEMIPATGAPLQLNMTPVKDGKVHSKKKDVHLKSTGFATAEITDLPASYRFTATIIPGAKTGSFGINLNRTRSYRGGCELQFEPVKKHAQWSTPADLGAAGFISPLQDIDSPNVHYKGWDFAIGNVEGLNKPITLDVIVKYDPTTRITLADACIDGRRTMITNRYNLKGNTLYLFVKGGEVTFSNITVRPLIEQN